MWYNWAPLMQLLVVSSSRTPHDVCFATLSDILMCLFTFLTSVYAFTLLAQSWFWRKKYVISLTSSSFELPQIGDGGQIGVKHTVKPPPAPFRRSRSASWLDLECRRSAVIFTLTSMLLRTSGCRFKFKFITVASLWVIVTSYMHRRLTIDTRPCSRLLLSHQHCRSLLPVSATLLLSKGRINGCQSNRWQTISVTSQFGDSHNLSTNNIFRPYTCCVCLHLAKFIVEHNFYITFLLEFLQHFGNNRIIWNLILVLDFVSQTVWRIGLYW